MLKRLVVSPGIRECSSHVGQVSSAALHGHVSCGHISVLDDVADVAKVDGCGDAVKLNVGRPKARLPVIAIHAKPLGRVGGTAKQVSRRLTIVITSCCDGRSEMKHSEQAQRFRVSTGDVIA
jgi:hypothetical protein